MNDDIAMLAEPDKEQFSSALSKLLADRKLRMKLAAAAKKIIQRDHSYTVFRQRVHDLYTRLDSSKH